MTDRSFADISLARKEGPKSPGVLVKWAAAALATLAIGGMGYKLNEINQLVDTLPTIPDFHDVTLGPVEKRDVGNGSVLLSAKGHRSNGANVLVDGLLMAPIAEGRVDPMKAVSHTVVSESLDNLDQRVVVDNASGNVVALKRAGGLISFHNSFEFFATGSGVSQKSLCFGEAVIWTFGRKPFSDADQFRNDIARRIKVWSLRIAEGYVSARTKHKMASVSGAETMPSP